MNVVVQISVQVPFNSFGYICKAGIAELYGNSKVTLRNLRCLQILPSVPWGAKSPPFENDGVISLVKSTLLGKVVEGAGEKTKSTTKMNVLLIEKRK